MTKIYVDLDTVAHLFATQHSKELAHQEKTIADPEKRSQVRLEVSSTLYHLFSKILHVVEMSHPMSGSYRHELLNKVTLKGGAFLKCHYTLKDVE